MTTTTIGPHELHVYDDSIDLNIKRPRGDGDLWATYSRRYDSVSMEGMDYEGDQRIDIPIDAFTAFMTEVAKMRAQRPSDSEGDAAT